MATGKRGRRRKPAEEEVELEEQAGGGVAEAIASAAAPELEDDVLGELEDDSERYVVAIWRRVEQGAKLGKLEYLARFSAGEFSLDAVRDRFGGGSYEFRVMRKDDRGRERYYRSRSMVLAGAPKHPGDGPALVGSPVAVVAPPAGEESRLIREELERSRRATAAMRRKLEALENRPQTSPLEWITALAPIVLPLLKPSRGGTEDFVRALELGVKLGNRGGGEDSPLGPIVDKALGVVSNIMQNGHAHNGAASSSSQTGAGKQPGNETAPAIAAAKLAPVWLQRAQPYFPVIAAWARAGDDPAARVPFVVNALDDQTRDELGAACEAEDFVPNTLAALPPGFRGPALVSWTTRFLQLVQETMAPADEEAER